MSRGGDTFGSCRSSSEMVGLIASFRAHMSLPGSEQEQSRERMCSVAARRLTCVLSYLKGQVWLSGVDYSQIFRG
jgi:hypothetical protein